MPIQSPLDAISPAFARTQLVLFSPFRAGRTWKLCGAGYLAMTATVFLPLPLVVLAFLPMIRRANPAAVPWVAGALVVLLVIYLAVYYPCSRLRFATMDIVLHRGTQVAPAWRKYGAQAFQWTAFKVVLGTLFVAAVGWPVVVSVQKMMPTFKLLVSEQAGQAGQPPSPEMMSALISLYAGFLVLYLGVLLFYWVSSLLSDLMVPTLAIEDTELAEAFGRVWSLVRREPGQFIGYAFLKLGLALAGQIAVTLAAYLGMLIVVVVVGVVALAGYLVLHALGVSGHLLGGLDVVLGLGTYVFFVFYLMVLAIGTMSTFLESYTLYFLSGRMPSLAGALAGSTPVVTPPAPLPPAPLPPAPLQPAPLPPAQG